MNLKTSLTLISLPIGDKSPTSATLHHEVSSGTQDRLNCLFHGHLSGSEGFLYPIGRYVVSLIIRLRGFTSISLMSLSVLFCVSPLGYHAFVRGGLPYGI